MLAVLGALAAGWFCGFGRATALFAAIFLATVALAVLGAFWTEALAGACCAAATGAATGLARGTGFFCTGLAVFAAATLAESAAFLT